MNAVDVTLILKPPLAIENLLASPISYTLYTKMQQKGDSNQEQQRMTGKWYSILSKGKQLLQNDCNV
jgi:hypothetical protein